MVQSYQEAVEEIKSKLDIVEVVQRYVVLKKSGANYIGCCPFHKEKTPSFSVNRQKGIFKCFGCGEGGDAISFLMKIQSKSFKEVIEDEAKALGIELPHTNGDGDFSKKKTQALEVMAAAQKYFTKNLLEAPEAEKARKYLESRSISNEIIEKYSLGYSFKSIDALQKALNCEPEILVTAGLIIKTDLNGRYADRFRNRLMIPVKDEMGKVIAFGARALEEGQNPKYLNSPDTILYNKSRIMYGFDTAKEEIIKKDSVLICEGYFDTISLQSGGVKNAVASCGTALTQDHIRLISKYSESRRIYLAFDTDNAGKMATERSADLIKEIFSGLGDIKQFDSSYTMSGNQYACEIRVVAPPEGKDPDEFIRENGGEAYIEHMKKAPLLLDYRLELALNEITSKTTPVEKKNIVEKILLLLEEIQNNIVQNEYITKISSRLHIDETVLKREFEALKSRNGIDVNPRVDTLPGQIVTKSSNFIEKMQKNLLSVFLTNISDSNRLDLISNIKAQKIEDENLKILWQTIDNLVFTSNNTQELIQELFKKFADNNKIKDLITDLIYLSKSYENLDQQEVQVAIKETTSKIEFFRCKEELKQLRQQTKENNNGAFADIEFQKSVNEKLKNKNWRINK